MKKEFKDFLLRENFLLALLHKVFQEYKTLKDSIHRVKPFRIVEILKISKEPGNTLFLIKLSHKNCTVKLTAAQIIEQGYSLNDFNDFHADLIRQAALGRLLDFLNLDENKPINRIVSKRLNHEQNEFLYKISNATGIQFVRSANEIVQDNELFQSLNLKEVYDISFTQGYESAINEKINLNKIKQT
jgi:hypothetical protein